mgnify:CR=1 FL=1
MTKIDLKPQKSKSSTAKIAPDSVEILGIRLSGSEPVELLKYLASRIAEAKKTFIVTPNPEFVVYAREHSWFKQILNQADIAIPDGIGLVWASRFLGRPLPGRVSGADVVEKILSLANQKAWRIGIMGARRGDVYQRQLLIQKLTEKYPRAGIFCLEETPDWQKNPPAFGGEIIFACQGMGEQEKWLAANYNQAKAIIFMGIGGSLDYLTGFVKRAPVWMRRLGLEWLYRLIRQPWRLCRQLALLKFIWLVLKEKFAS